VRVLLFHGPWHLTVEDRHDPVPGEGEVLVRVAATGICGSDRLVDGRVDMAGAPEAFAGLASGALVRSKVLVYPHGLPIRA
jgi:NADPH:quinone reductase-like Zn-dependent oxidoreductase